MAILRPGPASIICAARPGTCCAPRGRATPRPPRIRAVADALTLASAQLAVAREDRLRQLDRLNDPAEPGPSGGSILRGQHP